MQKRTVFALVLGITASVGAWAQPVPTAAYDANPGAIQPQGASDRTVDRRKYSTLETTDRSGRWDLGAGLSYSASDDSGSFDDAGLIDGRLSYGFNRWLGLGVDVGWQETDFNDDDLSAAPMFANALIRFPNDTPVVPYGTFGIGAILWDVEEDGIDDIDVDASLAFKVGGGADYFVSDHWALFGEVDYVFTDDDVEISSASRSVDLNYWTFGGGLKYVF